MNFITKAGEHGTKYLYEITYIDPLDPAFGEATWRTFAYNIGHAVERFYENEVESFGYESGFKPTRIARVPESRLMHHAVQHAL